MSLPAKSAGLMLSQLGRRGLSFLLRLSLLLLLSTPKNISVPYQASNASHPAASSFAWTFAELREEKHSTTQPPKVYLEAGSCPKAQRGTKKPKAGDSPGAAPNSRCLHLSYGQKPEGKP